MAKSVTGDKAKPDVKFSQNLNKRFFKNLKNGFFIECGANTGWGGSVGYFYETQLGWKGINIEANSYCYDALIQERPNCLNLGIALSNTKGTDTFHFPINRPRKNWCGIGSLIDGSIAGTRPKESKHSIGFAERKGVDVNELTMPGWGSAVEHLTVQTDTYSNVIRDHDVKKVDLFVLDVEGAELQVIEGMVGCSVMPKVLVVETHWLTEAVVTSALVPLGYKISGNDRYNTFYARKNNG